MVKGERMTEKGHVRIRVHCGNSGAPASKSRETPVDGSTAVIRVPRRPKMGRRQCCVVPRSFGTDHCRFVP